MIEESTHVPSNRCNAGQATKMSGWRWMGCILGAGSGLEKLSGAGVDVDPPGAGHLTVDAVSGLPRLG